jgi:hypothetical protein
MSKNLYPANFKTKTAVKLLDKLNLRFVFLALITANLFHTALPQGFGTLIGQISIANTSSPQAIRNAWGPGDAGSLLDAAITWAQLKNLNPDTQFWIVRLWSPGMSIIEVPLIWLTKIGIPIFWSLLSITITLWVINFTLVLRMMKSNKEILLGFIVIIILVNSWDFQYILREGLFYTEGLGYGLLFLGLLYISKTIASEEASPIRNKQKVIAGILVGASIWIRHTTDTALIFTIIIFCLALSYSKIKPQLIKLVNQEKLIKINQVRKNRLRLQSTIKSVIAIFLIALLITIPWRVISDQVFGGVKYSMSSAPRLIGPGLWLDKSVEAENYWVPFGVNWACRIDTIECERINSLGFSSFKNSELLELAIISALTHPVDYIQERYSFLTTFWISNDPPSSIKFKIASVLPLFYFLIIPLKKKRKWNSRISIIASMWIIYILLTVAQLAIIHFESRYFIPIRLLLIGLFFSLIHSTHLAEKKIKFIKS